MAKPDAINWSDRLQRMDHAARARRGAELLDRAMPDWWKKVDPKTLRFGERKLDILGQVYGDHYDGCRVLGLSTTDPWPKAELGLTFDISGFELAGHWRALIAERESAAARQPA